MSNGFRSGTRQALSQTKKIAVGQAGLATRDLAAKPVGQNQTPVGNPVVRTLLPLSIGLFKSEDGYSSIALALALLLSLSLIFGAATAQWYMSSAPAIQTVADSASLAGSQTLARYVQVVQVCDAVVLTLGLTGVVVISLGLVIACIPGSGKIGVKLVERGKRLMDVRRQMARSAYEGFQRMETLLPACIVSNSYGVVRRNRHKDIGYVGCALPVPLKSESKFHMAGDELDGQKALDRAEKLKALSDIMDEAIKEAGEAKKRGWWADCGNPDKSMRERAGKLAGLSAFSNPYYATPQDWDFGKAIRRARSYYRQRLAIEQPESSHPEEITRSRCRLQFYEYALRQTQASSYSKKGLNVSADLKGLYRNTSTMKETYLYTKVWWPVDSEGALHSYAGCPEVTPGVSLVSLAAADASRIYKCPQCRMCTSALGKVPAAATSVDTGFEHWWCQVVEAARDYQEACDKARAAEDRLRERGEDLEEGLHQALEELTCRRPEIKPPGYKGVFACVSRPDATKVPGALTVFSKPAYLKPGMAVAASTLAPDNTEEGEQVITSFAQVISQGLPGDLQVQGLVELWENLLKGYGSQVDSASRQAEDFFDRYLSFGPFSQVASEVKEMISGLMADVGLEPVDLRLRRPVLINTAQLEEASSTDGTSLLKVIGDAVRGHVSLEELLALLGLETPGGAEGSIPLLQADLPDKSMDFSLDLGLLFLGGL